jgi:hypothetical protein
MQSTLVFGAQMNQLKNSAVTGATLASGPSKWRRLAPIVLVECYLSFTVFVFAFGPWSWPIRNPVTLYTYLFVVQVALLFGYLSGTRTHDSCTVYTGSFSISTLRRVSVVLNILWSVPLYYALLGRDGFSVRGIMSHIVAGALDPGKAYTDKLDALSPSSTLLLSVYALFTPILWLAVPLGIVAWKSSSLKMKIAVAFIVSANVATWVALGTTKGIADNVAIVMFSMAAAGRTPLAHLKRATNLGNLRRVAVVVVGISALIFFFSYSQNSRSHGRMSMVQSGAGIAIDTNNIFMAGLPPELQSAEGKGAAYISQGYYGLSLALEEPFQWSYGIGHSLVLISLVKKMDGFDATGLTYPARVEHDGWNMSTRWDSIYPWLASDVTFPGTLLVVLLTGRLLAFVWADAQSGQNPYAVPLFVMVMIALFYFPANNQLLSTPLTFVAFWGLLYMWISTRGTIRKGRVRAWN